MSYIYYSAFLYDAKLSYRPALNLSVVTLTLITPKLEPAL